MWLYMKFLKMLKKTSLQPTVFVSREGSHWSKLSFFHFGYVDQPNSREIRIIYRLLRGLGVSIHSSLYLNRIYLLFTSLIGRILYSSHSARIGLIFYSLGWLSPLGVMTEALHILRFWKIPILQDLVKMYPLYFFIQEWSRSRESK